MTDTDRTTPEDEGAIAPPDPCISLSIRFPLVLEPMYRQVDGLVLMAWAGDTGEALFCRKLTFEDRDVEPAQFIKEKLPRAVPVILMGVYDGDDGRLMYASTVKPPPDEGDDEGDDEDGMPWPLSMVLSDAGADPDKPCLLCDEDNTVPDRADFDRSKVHRECMLANIIGPLGHHLDHEFWCLNMDDPNCGRGTRQANLDLAALVARYGINAIMSGDFPKDTALLGNEATGA